MLTEITMFMSEVELLDVGTTFAAVGGGILVAREAVVEKAD